MAAAPDEVRRVLSLVADEGAAEVGRLARGLEGSPEQVRAGLLEGVPAVVGYYSDGSSALAADWYDDVREEAAPPRAFTAEPVVLDRAEKFARAIVWAAGPLFLPKPDVEGVLLRLEPVVQKEVARPFRDTITTNSQRDPSSVGWRRITSGTGCDFCRMLSDRGAVYKATTARFAAHTSCHCSAAPVFDGQDGEEASVMQYVASRRRPSAKDRERVREYLKRVYGKPTPGGASSVTSAAAKQAAGFAGQSLEQVQKQLRILEGLKDSAYRTEQLARYRARLSQLNG